MNINEYEGLKRVTRTIRVRADLIPKLQESAKKENRSVNAEIEIRLIRSFEEKKSD